MRIGYRYSREALADNFNGSSRLSTGAVLEDFLAAPLTSTRVVHALEAMYAPNDRLTLAAAASFSQLSASHVARTNEAFTLEADGVGDIWLAALVGLRRHGALRSHLQAGVFLPTGSITLAGELPGSAAPLQLPYPMQIGSGTMDIAPGVTVTGTLGVFAWGLKTSARLPLGDNSRGWRSGAALHGTAWAALRVTEWASVSARMAGSQVGEHQGHDLAYQNPEALPSFHPQHQGGSRLDLPLGLSLGLPRGPLAGHLLQVEWRRTVARDLNGPQLGDDWALTAAWRWTAVR